MSFSLIDYPSPWPLPKFLYAYSSYVYTQDWKSVTLTFYLVKVIYVLLFYLDGGAHPRWFDGLGNLNVKGGSEGGEENEPSLASVMVGDFIFLVMGMVLGKIQSKIVNDRMFYSFVYGFKFKTVDAWKKHFAKLVIPPSSQPQFASNRAKLSFVEEYGLWPMRRIFACDFSYYGCCQCLDKETTEDFDFTEKEGKGDTGGFFKRLEYERDRLKWAHRRFYWIYFIQVIFFGTPATVVYTVDSNEYVRSGVLVYYLFQLILLTVFYFWNKHDHVVALSWYYEKQRQYVKPTSKTYKNATWYTRFNAIYLCWFFTVTFFSTLIVFKSSLNVSLTIAYAWIFSGMLWGVVYASFKATDFFYPTILNALILHSWLITNDHQNV